MEEFEIYEPTKLRYYQSEKILGRLYREIDEQDFLQEIQKQSILLGSHDSTTHNLLDTVWMYVQSRVVVIQWQHYIEFANDVKERYVAVALPSGTLKTLSLTSL